MSRRLKAYLVLTGLTAVTLLATHAPASFDRVWGHYVAWVVICLVSETMWTANLSGEATWSLAATAGLCAVVLWGPEAGMWISMLSTLIADLFVQRKIWYRATFNAAQIALTAWLAGVVFDGLGGRAALPIHAGIATLDRSASTALVLPFVGMSIVYFGLNRAMVSLAVSWSGPHRNWWTVMREEWLYLAKVETDGAAFLLVPLMAISFTAIGYPGVLLFYAPLFMLHQSEKRYLDLKRAEEQNLRTAQFVAKGEIAASIGHDLNNLLTPIISGAQLLLRDVERNTLEQAPKRVATIVEKSKQMAVLAKGLMDYTRSHANVEPMDLNGLLVSTIEFVKGDTRFRNVEWEVDLDPNLPSIKGDLGQIQNVFMNLFLNAADAMSAQESRRAIRVATRQSDHGKEAEVVVADSGPGIKPENLPKMFEFMFTTKADGHGFGLSTSQRAIHNHGGTITVQNQEGSGAEFTIVLPVRGPGGWR